MIETLLGTLLGGAFRLVPEVFKIVDRKDERKHELAMLDKNIEADKLKLEQDRLAASTQVGLAEISAIIEATKAQAVQTGVKWVDAVNSLMRPLITFWWVIVLYSAALTAQFVVLVDGGQSFLQAILKLWGPDEKAIVASIVSFWFVDRSLRKPFGK